jgi:hypothetical protein
MKHYNFQKTNLTNSFESYNSMLKTTLTNEWMVTEIKAAEICDQTLLKSLKPFIECVLGSGIAERYYFERVANESSSIFRLFIRCNSQELRNDLVQPYLIEHLNSHFRLNQSVDSFSERKINYLEFPANMVENAFFGNIAAQVVAERYYEASSTEVIRRLCGMKDADANSLFKMATSIEMHLGFAYMCGMELEESMSFFQYLYEKNESFKPQNEPSDYGNTMKSTTLFHEKIWEKIGRFDAKKAEFESEEKWLLSVFYTCYDLKSIRKSGLLDHVNTDGLWALYAELLRFTNRQLQITGQDESKLYYTMSKSMKELALK